MKKIIWIAVVIFLAGSSCKKYIEEKKKDVLIEAITSGAWYVEKYTEGQIDFTQNFAGYDFLFNENGTVAARYSTTSIPGTWTGNITTYQITSNFPSAGEPINRLNGTWVLINSTMTFVEAEMGVGPDKKILHLRQKP